MLKPRTRALKIAERITRLKKFHVEALNLTFKIHITLNSYFIFEKKAIKKTVFKTLSTGNDFTNNGIIYFV